MPRAATTTGRMAAITAIVGADFAQRRHGLKVSLPGHYLAAPSLTAQQLGPPAHLQADEVIRAMDRTWIETVTASGASEAELPRSDAYSVQIGDITSKNGADRTILLPCSPQIGCARFVWACVPD